MHADEYRLATSALGREAAGSRGCAAPPDVSSIASMRGIMSQGTGDSAVRTIGEPPVVQFPPIRIRVIREIRG